MTAVIAGNEKTMGKARPLRGRPVSLPIQASCTGRYKTHVSVDTTLVHRPVQASCIGRYNYPVSVIYPLCPG
jgi:hypothetical protein